ncbi:MAG: ABC transporter ATP-binding protein/permease [Defluviitaleaceae bacterium]|nr:ABC transporter ATP-binding protein/permease [Defluviitaleaceae bacterium]
MSTIKVPEYMRAPFTAVGVPFDSLVYAMHTDMTLEGNFSDAYVAVDKENLYILYGIEEIVKTEGARRIVPIYKIDNLVTHKLKDLGELKTETLLSTCRMISTKDGEQHLILLFSLGYQTFADRMIKVIKNIEEGKDPLEEIREDEALFCPKCGTRYPEPERALCPKCTDKMGIFFRLLGFFKYYKGKVAACFTVMLVITGMSILAPLISTQLFLDEVITEGGRFYRMVWQIVLVVVAVRLLGTCFQILFNFVLAKTMPWIIYDLQLRIFEAMQRLSVSFYTSKRTGSLMNRVGRDSRNIYWFFVDGLPYVVLHGATFIGIAIVMFRLEWRLTLIILTVIPFAGFMFRVLMRVFRRYHHKFWVMNSQLNNMVSDAVNGQRVIKAFAREGEESRRFRETGEKQMAVEISSANLGVTAFPAIWLFMALGEIAVTGVGAMMIIRGELTIGVLLAFLAYSAMLSGPLQFMSTVSTWWARCVDAAQRVFEITDAKADIEEPENPIVLDPLRGEITVKNVWFQYEPAKPILKGMDLHVPAGQTLGLVGKTGAGKSTLANLIARLYDPTEGEVLVDGINVKELSLQQLRTSIGIVSQDIYLFIGSIADNIRYARPDATIEEVMWAAKMASAHDFIAKLPDAYETRVGAGGQDLSGGEKQRLSIARTIIQNPKILILDEATAAMDTETEGKIQDALNKLQANRTTIAIAHRLSTLKDAQHLAVINEGKVVESGSHEELMRLKGEYHKLYTIQMEGLKVISMD